MFTPTRPSIPAPTSGPDPLAELRAARAFLMRLVDQPAAPGLEQFIARAGALAAAALDDAQHDLDLEPER